MRFGDPGGVVRIDLGTGKAQDFFTQAHPYLSRDSLGLAVDATHVYRVRRTDGSSGQSELWKRAKCGGEAVRIAQQLDRVTSSMRERRGVPARVAWRSPATRDRSGLPPCHRMSLGLAEEALTRLVSPISVGA